MVEIVWSGLRPPKVVTESLRRAGLTAGNKGPVHVVWTKTRRVPAPPGPDAPWLWLCAQTIALGQATEAILRGAYDVVSAAEPEFAETLAQRVAELSRARPPLPESGSFIATCSASRRVLAQIARAARTSMPVLLTGETGTGKDVGARLLHEWSPRREARFVPINCAAVPDDLIESELFGYVRGAFSGAVRGYEGQLRAAGGGTVYLDEIDETPQTLQAKLLRVLEDRVVSRLGENEWHEVDFRIVAASNRDLTQMVREGRFGADLYERLAIVSIHMPPLRERIDDLPALVDYFIDRFYVEEPPASEGARVSGVGPRAMAALRAYHWPGNVRELRNVLFGSLVNKRAGDELLLGDLPAHVLRPRSGVRDGGDSLFDRYVLASEIDAGRFNLRREVQALEREALVLALERTGGNASRAARLLGQIGRGSATDPGGTVRAMMRRLGIKRRD